VYIQAHEPVGNTHRDFGDAGAVAERRGRPYASAGAAARQRAGRDVIACAPTTATIIVSARATSARR
jgi:hypothetical protein